jgi:hypothetical protein
VTRHRIALAGLAAAALAGAPAAAAKDTPRPVERCQVPDSGYQSCLRVRYVVHRDGRVEQVHVTATLLRKLDRCPSNPVRRQVVIRRDGTERVATQRRKPTCRKGLTRWRAELAPPATDGWGLSPGASIGALWSGTKAATSVTIEALAR